MNLSIYNTELQKVLIIGDRFVSCLWSEGYNSAQPFTLELQRAGGIEDKIKPDYFVSRKDRNTLMVIKTVEVDRDRIVISGKQATVLLDDVAFVGTIPENSVIDTAVPAAYQNSSRCDRVTFAQTALGVRYEHQISNKSFLQLCETMCKDTGVGIRAVKNGGDNISMEFYQPNDTGVVLSDYIGNLADKTIVKSTQGAKNYAIVLGGGEGAERVRVDVDLTGGGARRELIVDAKDLQQAAAEPLPDYQQRLYARGVEKLLEKPQTFAVNISPSGDDFGTRYDLGDIVHARLAPKDTVNLFNSDLWYYLLHEVRPESMQKLWITGRLWYKVSGKTIHDYQFMQGEFKPNTQYTISFVGRQYDQEVHTTSGFRFHMTDGSSVRVKIDPSYTPKVYSLTSPAGKTVDWIELYYNYTDFALFQDIMLTEGDSPAKYKPYDPTLYNGTLTARVTRFTQKEQQNATTTTVEVGTL